MNLRKVAVILVSVAILFGVGTMLFDGGGTNPPFEKSNETLPELEQKNVQEPGNETLTQKDVALNTVYLSQKQFELTVSTTERTRKTENVILYTLTKSIELFRFEGDIVYEYYHSPQFTAVKEHHSNSATYDLRDPQTDITNHLHKQLLESMVTSMNLTVSNSYTQNGTKYTQYSSNNLETSGDALATHLGVDRVVRVREATMTRNENGIITNSHLEVVVEQNGQTYALTKNYNLTLRSGVELSQPSWVQQAIAQNIGVSAYKLSNDKIVIQHKYGTTLLPNDTIYIESSTGTRYSIELNNTFEAGDTAVFIVDNGSAELVMNPTQTVNGKDVFIESNQRYTIVFRSESKGVVGVQIVKEAT